MTEKQHLFSIAIGALDKHYKYSVKATCCLAESGQDAIDYGQQMARKVYPDTEGWGEYRVSVFIVHGDIIQDAYVEGCVSINGKLVHSNDLLSSAICFASSAHKSQADKGGKP